MEELLYQFSKALEALDSAPKTKSVLKAYEHILEARFILKQQLKRSA